MATVSYTVIDGEIISENRNGVERDYMPDPLGSTLALLDNTQTKTDTFTYWPYGEVKARTGTTPTPFQYIGTRGYYQDSSTKTYVRARYLDTQKGRWMTADPIGFVGGDWNLYRVANANPLNHVDPSGLAVYQCCAFGRPIGLQHCFVSTNQCGAVGISGGGFDRGHCRRDDIYLAPDPVYKQPPHYWNPKRDVPENPPIHTLPSVPRPGWNVHCVKVVGDDPILEAAVCACMKEMCTFGPWYIFPINTCVNWGFWVMDCAYRVIEPYPPTPLIPIG